MAPSSPGNSTGGLFNRRGNGSSSEKGGPVPVLFDHYQIAQRGAQRGGPKALVLPRCLSKHWNRFSFGYGFFLPVVGDMSVLVRRPHRR